MRGDEERNIQELIKAKYRSEYSNIPRVISDDKVPITEAYINLRIVTRKSAKRKEMQFFDQNATGSQAVDELRGLQLKTYTSLYEEDQLELKEAVAIEQIFDETSSNPAPKKIAVYGRAGIGKSVLCRLLAMKWQEGKLWKNKFEAVIWLPLRELLAYPSSPKLETYFANIIKSKYLNGLNAPDIEEVQEYIFGERNRGKILIILDGHDEIINSMPLMLQQLLSAMFADPHYHIIVTSRPITITIGDNPINFDQELESIGFTRENIKSYVRKFYKGNPALLMQFIESNHHIGNIAHIPLNLELICDVWSPDKAARWTHNVTGLYQEITKYFFERMGKKGVFPCDEARKEVLIELLGEIALEGMSSMKSIISPNEFGSIINRKERALATKGLLEELLGLGVIKVIPVNKEAKDNQVYFIHHTFQEYFAAMSIALGFEHYPDEDEYKAAIAMLKEHKYTPYYEVMWISVAGILYANCNAREDYLPLFQFWDAFENEPRELLGIKHDVLKLKLLEECPSLKNPPKALQSLNAALIDTTYIVAELFKIIEGSAEPVKKLQAIEAIVSLDKRTPEIISKLEVVMRKDSVEGVRLYAAESILRLGSNSKEALELLLKAPEHLKRYRQAALARIYEIEALDLGIKQMIGTHIAKEASNTSSEQPTALNPAVLALEKQAEIGLLEEACTNFDKAANLASDMEVYQGALHGGIFGTIAIAAGSNTLPAIILSGITSGLGTRCDNRYINIINGIGASAITFAIANTGYASFSTAAALTFSALPVMCVGMIAIGLGSGIVIAGRKSYSIVNNQIFSSISPELDELSLSNNQNKLTAICELANNNANTIMSWSTEGLLNIALAIRLYSHSSQLVWLEPMRDITFIYKDASILLTIAGKGDNRRILDVNLKEPLTKNWKETEEVIRTMKAAYEKAGLSTKLMDHYLSGKSLDVSTPTEKLAIARRVRSNRPMGLTPLHRAAEAGAMLKVIELIQKEGADINHFDNNEGITPLILAIRARKYKVAEYLVEQGADVNVGGGAYEAHDQPILLRRMLAKGCSMNEALLRKMLAYAIYDYQLHNTAHARWQILNKLSILVTGEDRRWMVSSQDVDIHRMSLRNEHYHKRDRIGEIRAKGDNVQHTLKIRLHVYLELYVRLAARTADEPLGADGQKHPHLSLDEVLEKLYIEIKLMAETYNCTKAGLNLYSDQELRVLYSEGIVQHLAGLEVGGEYIIASDSIKHCMYVALHKLSKYEVLIRVDNRWLGYDVDREKHGVEPYLRNSDIKSYCVGIINLLTQDNREILRHYISYLLGLGTGNDRFPQVYGVGLPTDIAMPYTQLPARVQHLINNWPCHPIQEGGTNNCTVSSYNLGISIRHNMVFFEWLIGMELSILPPPISISPGNQLANARNLSGIALKGGNDSHTHIELMDKFQKELKVPYSEVLTGITVEQTLVNMAGIKTKQTGASFRRYNDTSTVFQLVLTSFSEQQRFINYYTTCYPDLISKSLLKEEIGQMSIFMDTRKLYEEIAPALGKYIGTNKKENINAKWC